MRTCLLNNAHVEEAKDAKNGGPLPVELFSIFDEFLNKQVSRHRLDAGRHRAKHERIPGGKGCFLGAVFRLCYCCEEASAGSDERTPGVEGKLLQRERYEPT